MITNNLVKKYLLKFINHNYQKIDVKSGKILYNQRCHINSVHFALKNKEKYIAMCFSVKDDYPIIHFINLNKNGQYIDNTFGEWSKIYEYFLVKKIKRKKFFDVNIIFSNFRKEIYKNIPFHLRWFSTLEI